jgi:hypothetical protein
MPSQSPHCAISIRLPHVSSKIAVVTGPIATRAGLLLEVVDRKRHRIAHVEQLNHEN